MKNILVYSQLGFISYPLQEATKYNGIQFIQKNDQVYYMSIKPEEKSLSHISPYQLTEIKTHYSVEWFEIIDAEEVVYHRDKSEIVFINEDSFGTFNMDNCRISVVEGNIRNPDKQKIFVNGVLHNTESVTYDYGDHLKINQVVFMINENTITVYGNHRAYSTDLIPTDPDIHHLRNFPKYHRSPRIIYQIPNERLDLIPPKDPSRMSKSSLMAVIMTPLISLGASVAMIIILNRGPFVYIMIATTIVTSIIAVMKYFSDKKRIKIENEEKDELYEKYLMRMRKKLEDHRKYEERALSYHHPTIANLAIYVSRYSSRIYEKDQTDDDFLHIKMGVANDKSSMNVDLKTDEIEVVKDERIEEIRQIKRKYSSLENKPIVIDMKISHVGLVGEAEEIHEQIKQMLAQITFFHSYHDVEIIMLYSEKFQETFDYVRWYPHMRISAINVRGNIYQANIRDQILTSLTQILKQRKIVRDEEKKMSSFIPHYIIFIDDYSLVINHGIMEYLQEESTELGFTLVFSAKQKADLPENIKTVVLVEDLQTNRLLISDGKLVDKQLESPQVKNIDLEWMARDLSVLDHQLGAQSIIPEAITFFELFNVKKPEELNIMQKWQENESHKSLSVPLGVRGVDDIVYLNLHEKAHGPHGLVAGTTGSGKSEIIQSYILSLAVNFHPHEVGFLLIDYKGGGMANLFKNLPHLLGTITNLDGNEAMRALASIKSELKRRQKIFNDHDVNNIIRYNKLFKSGLASEPLPSLFLISDEFAEMKKEQPEFMSELVSVARIGRTLGIKLILATQKPGGIIDDQIWSNSKFKLALKVQSEGDSREVIKTPDAAYITQPGRSYLQVGNHEVYELFQSAWSGATYEDEEQEKVAETFVYRINDLGQEELVNKDLSDSDDDSSSAVQATQLDVVIDHIAEVHKGLNAKEVIKPWLPSLDEQIVSPHFTNEFHDVSKYKKLDLQVAIGIVDIPEKQEQQEYSFDLIKEGNLALIAASGYGKSFTLGLIMMSLAIKNSPELLHYYIVDFGNSALIPFVNLPHTADYMTFDANEKILKFMKLIEGEIKERKKLFAQATAQNFEMYNQIKEDDPLKAIIVVLDNHDVVKEMEFDFERFFMRLSRDGFGVGIYVLMTANVAIRYSTFNNFKKRIAGYLHEKNDFSSVVGRVTQMLPEIKGRAVVKLENINTMQIYTPFAFENTIEYVEKLKQAIGEIKDKNTGRLPMKIPVLPDVFTSEQFDEYSQESPPVTVKIGLCVTEVVSIDARIDQSPYVIIGPAKTGKTNLLKLYLSQLSKTDQIYLFDSPAMELFSYKEHDNVTYIQTQEEITKWADKLVDEILARQTEFKAAMEIEAVSPQTFYTALPAYTVLIDGMDQFVKKAEKIKGFEEILTEACNVGIRVIATATAIQAKANDLVTRVFKSATYGVLLGEAGANNISVGSKEYPIFGQGLLFDSGNYRRVLIPKYAHEEEE